MLRTRLAWLVAMIPLIVVALVTCTDDAAKTTGTPDAATTAAVAGETECPKPDAAPEAGQGCVLPEGTTCAFGVCNEAIAKCAQGAWLFGGNVAETPTCPSDFPVSASACPSCFPADLQCNYGSTDCSSPDASTNRSVASCPAGVWVIETFPCSDASAEAPIPDAGADVQGDAAPDSD